jgi:PPM family protein phosphatase
MLTVSCRTHVGNVRANNEDRVAWDADLSLAVVADGMGGHSAGEVASGLAVEAVRSFVRESATAPDDVTRPFGVDPHLSSNANRLAAAIKTANRIVFRESEAHDEYHGMGTTIVAALADGQRLTYASVGDSRIYSFANANLQQLTRDDSWVAMLTAESGLEASAFEKHPMRHVLTNVIGARDEVAVKVQELDLIGGQTILLCSDGLYGALGDEGMRTTLAAERDLDRAADRLIAAALARDGRDNISVLLARYTEPSDTTPSSSS